VRRDVCTRFDCEFVIVGLATSDVENGAQSFKDVNMSLLCKEWVCVPHSPMPVDIKVHALREAVNGVIGRDRGGRIGAGALMARENSRVWVLHIYRNSPTLTKIGLDRYREFEDSRRKEK